MQFEMQASSKIPKHTHTHARIRLHVRVYGFNVPGIERLVEMMVEEDTLHWTSSMFTTITQTHSQRMPYTYVTRV